MRTRTEHRDFWIGTSVGCLLAVGLNLLPYLRTRGAYQADGFELIGFPFVFRSFGGFTYRLYVSWGGARGHFVGCTFRFRTRPCLVKASDEVI
jgi:hypothetical protein